MWVRESDLPLFLATLYNHATPWHTRGKEQMTVEDAEAVLKGYRQEHYRKGYDHGIPVYVTYLRGRELRINFRLSGGAVSLLTYPHGGQAAAVAALTAAGVTLNR